MATLTRTTQQVFDAVDSLNVPTFAEMFANDGTLVFANGAAMTGPAEVEAGVCGFFSTIVALHHHIVNEWTVGDTTIVELVVTYDRLDGNYTSIPVVSIWTTRPDGLFSSYRVFFDLAPVFAPISN